MSSAAYITGGVFLIFLVTYLVRALPLLLVKGKIKSPFVLAFLRYVPYAVLSSLTIPAIFSSTETGWGAAAGFAVALFLALREKSLIVTASLAALAVLLVETLFALLGA